MSDIDDNKVAVQPSSTPDGRPEGIYPTEASGICPPDSGEVDRSGVNRGYPRIRP